MCAQSGLKLQLECRSRDSQPPADWERMAMRQVLRRENSTPFLTGYGDRLHGQGVPDPDAKMRAMQPKEEGIRT